MTSPKHLTGLIADDDGFFRLALSGIMTQQLGFSRSIETGSFDEAMEQLGNHPDIHLALFDLAMPGMTSAANLLAVRECAPRTKLIVVSGSTERRDILLSLDAGVHGYVPKTLGPAELTRALQSVMDGAIFVPPSLAEIVHRPARDKPIFATRDAGPGHALMQSLTARQRDVLKLLVEGDANKDIARKLHLGEGTVKIHVASLFRSLKVQNRSAAAATGALLLDPRVCESNTAP
jgi:DNA-binding NarL/FixJ family response regulator